MTINILGTDYSIEKKNRSDDDSLNDCGGYCDHTSKRIVVSEKDNNCNLDDFQVYQNRVLRHEIVHAFMFESGFAENWEHKEYGHEETVVDWFAMQGLKIYKAWEQAECV